MLGKKHFTPVAVSAVPPAGLIPIIVGNNLTRYHVAPPVYYIPERLVKKNRAIYTQPKILFVKTGTRPVAALDTAGHITMQSCYNFQMLRRTDESLLYPILAILNSKLTAYFLFLSVTANKLLMPQFNQSHITELPVPDLDVITDERRQKVTRFAEEMIQATSNRIGSRTDADRNYWAREADRLDRRIDEIVYELYDLSPAEIALVERAAA